MGKIISFIVIILGIYLPAVAFGSTVHILSKTPALIKTEMDLDSSKPGERRLEVILFENAERAILTIFDIALLEKLRSRIGDENPITLLVDENSRVFGFIENNNVIVPGSLFLSYSNRIPRSADGSASTLLPLQQRLVRLEKTSAVGFGKKIELEIGKWPVATVVTGVDASLKPREEQLQFGGLKILESLFMASKKYKYEKTFTLNEMTSLYFSELNVDLYRLKYDGNDVVVAGDYQIVFFSPEPRKVFVLATDVFDEADLEFLRPNL